MNFFLMVSSRRYGISSPEIDASKKFFAGFVTIFTATAPVEAECFIDLNEESKLQLHDGYFP